MSPVLPFPISFTFPQQSLSIFLASKVTPSCTLKANVWQLGVTTGNTCLSEPGLPHSVWQFPVWDITSNVFKLLLFYCYLCLCNHNGAHILHWAHGGQLSLFPVGSGEWTQVIKPTWQTLTSLAILPAQYDFSKFHDVWPHDNFLEN